MVDWTLEQRIAWLRHVHGGDFDEGLADGPSTIADTLNQAVRKAGSDLPFDREPAQYDRLFQRMADRRHKDD